MSRPNEPRSAIAAQRRSGGDAQSSESASTELIRANRDWLRRAAGAVGLTNLRVDTDGTIVVHSDRPGYGEVIDFAADATDELGYTVFVVTDDSPTRRPGAMDL